MDESRSLGKTVKASQPRGAKALNKEASSQRDSSKPANRSRETKAATLQDEHNTGQQVGHSGPGRTPTDSQDKKRGRMTRLSGSTSSGDRGKGKVAGPQQQQQQQQLVAPSLDSSSTAAYTDSSSLGPGTPERGGTQQDSKVAKEHGESQVSSRVALTQCVWC